VNSSDVLEIVGPVGPFRNSMPTQWRGLARNTPECRGKQLGNLLATKQHGLTASWHKAHQMPSCQASEGALRVGDRVSVMPARRTSRVTGRGVDVDERSERAASFAYCTAMIAAIAMSMNPRTVIPAQPDPPGRLNSCRSHLKSSFHDGSPLA
jgi:hypothetical protein